MRVTNIEFAKRVRTGDFEHEDYKAYACLEEGDITSSAFSELKKEIESTILGKTKPSKSKPKKEEPKKEEPKKEEPKKEEPKKEEPKKEKTTSKKKTTKKASRGVPYNRGIQQHKTDFLSIVAEKDPEWKNNILKKVQEASIKMEGSEMYNKDGQVLKEFKEKLLKELD